MTGFAYPVDLAQEKKGLWTAVMPDVQSAHTQGKDRADALRHALDALEGALGLAMARGGDIPAPSPARGRPVVVPSARAALKLHIYDAMRRRGLRKADLARLLGVRPSLVDRLLDVRHNSTIDQLDAALKALGVRIKTMEAA
jgi:antitoxin HicB